MEEPHKELPFRLQECGGKCSFDVLRRPEARPEGRGQNTPITTPPFLTEQSTNIATNSLTVSKRHQCHSTTSWVGGQPFTSRQAPPQSLDGLARRRSKVTDGSGTPTSTSTASESLAKATPKSWTSTHQCTQTLSSRLYCFSSVLGKLTGQIIPSC